MHKILTLLLSFLFCLTSFARMILESNKDYIGVNETLTIVVAFENQEKERYTIEGIENFDILSRGSSSSYSIVNFTRNVVEQDIYILRPRREGKYILRVNQNGNRSNPLQVSVENNYRNSNYSAQFSNQNYYYGYPMNSNNNASIMTGTNNNNSNNNSSSSYYGNEKNNYIIINNLKNKEVYFGEKFIYEEKFIATSPFREFEYLSRPDFKEFSATDYTPLENKKNFKQNIIDYNGKKAIEVILYRGVLQGNSSGDKTLQTGKGEVLSSSRFLIPEKKIDIKVKAIPEENKPLDFSGIIGRLEVTSNWNTQYQEVGKPITLNLKICGDVNIDNIDKIKIKENSDFNIFQTLKSSTEEIKNKKYYSEKDFEIVYVPKKSGMLEIDDITIDYFDTELKKYSTKIVEGKKIEIKGIKGDLSSINNNLAPNNSTVQNINSQGQVNIANANSTSTSNDKQNTEIDIVSNFKEKNKIDYLKIGLFLVILIQGLVIYKLKYRNSKKIIKNINNKKIGLEKMKKINKDDEFYKLYCEYMQEIYNFNPRIHSETKLNSENLKKINRILEEWKFLGTPLDKKNIVQMLEKEF